LTRGRRSTWVAGAPRFAEAPVKTNMRGPLNHAPRSSRAGDFSADHRSRLADDPGLPQSGAPRAPIGTSRSGPRPVVHESVRTCVVQKLHSRWERMSPPYQESLSHPPGKNCFSRRENFTRRAAISSRRWSAEFCPVPFRDRFNRTCPDLTCAVRKLMSSRDYGRTPSQLLRGDRTWTGSCPDIRVPSHADRLVGQAVACRRSRRLD
jgi:hypothetical protein